MEIAIIILLALILLETTFLMVKTGVAKRNTSQKRKIYVDTSALIDGRILKIASSGFMNDRLIIPRSVVRELQTLADGKEHEKRKLARDGMQVVRDLERVEYCEVEILQDALDRTPVDERLLALAKENRGVILTTDYNLCQVAATEHVETLNPNTLSVALGNEVQDGTIFDIRITGTGAKMGQGVGHLDNGIMVVVSHADNLVGQTVRVVARRSNTTESGRIVFADIVKPIKNQETRSQSHTARGRAPSRKTKAQKSTK
ncbi:MAG: TRAM domain-containing protein [Candidatus Saccharibacteria bacterium]|nr:TRAM domain-containing protein [Candidatus Saccharibacteria bacterium]